MLTTCSLGILLLLAVYAALPLPDAMLLQIATPRHPFGKHGAIPRWCHISCRSAARPGQDEPAQHRVPGGGKSGADGGRSLEPWLVRRAAGEGAALHGPGVRWVGLLPGLLWYLTCTHPRAALQRHYRQGS